MTPLLPPLADLFALSDPDPAVLQGVEAELRAGGEFAEVWRPAVGWVAAAAPLPCSSPDGPLVREAGLAFTEGRDGALGSVPEPGTVARLVGEPAGPARLPGDVGLVAFEPHGVATVVRSAGGLVPFHLAKSGPSWAVATRVGDLVRYLPDPPRIDPLVWGIWAAGWGWLPDGRSFLDGVLALPRGHTASLRPGREPVLRRWFDPRPDSWPRPDRALAREHAQQLRELLLAALEADLHPDGGNLLALSGGVDSSSLGALAAGTVGRPVWSLSIVPPPGDPVATRERGYVDALAERYHFERRWIVDLEPAGLLELLGQAPAVPFPVGHPVLCSLPRVCQEAGVRVLFGGEFADEICGSRLTVPDWAVATSLPRLLAGLHRLPTGRRDLLRWASWRVVWPLHRPRLSWPADLPEVLAPEVRAEYRQWRRDTARAASVDARPWRFLALWCQHDGWLAMNWEATSLAGVRRSFPFLSRGMLDLVHECHPAELVGPGTKRLLRAALAGDVPAGHLGRPDKGSWTPPPDDTVAVALELPDVLATVLDPAMGPARRLPVREALALTLLATAARRLEDRRACRPAGRQAGTGR